MSRKLLIGLAVAVLAGGILAAVACCGVLGFFGTSEAKKREAAAKIRTAKVKIMQYESAIEAYYEDTQAFPNALADLIARPSDLPRGGRWNGPYLDGSEVPDPWGHPYRYKLDPTNQDVPYRVTSDGPNGIAGDKDDVFNPLDQ